MILFFCQCNTLYQTKPISSSINQLIRWLKLYYIWNNLTSKIKIICAIDGDFERWSVDEETKQEK